MSPDCAIRDTRRDPRFRDPVSRDRDSRSRDPRDTMVCNLTRRFRARRLRRLADGQSPRSKRHAKPHQEVKEFYVGTQVCILFCKSSTQERDKFQKIKEPHSRKHFFLLTMQEPKAGATLCLQPFRELHAGKHLLLLLLEELLAGTTFLLQPVTELHTRVHFVLIYLHELKAGTRFRLQTSSQLLRAGPQVLSRGNSTAILF